MKAKALVFLFIIICFSVKLFSQPVRNDLADQNLFGSVASIKTYSQYKEYGNWIINKLYTFNVAGNITSIGTYNSSGERFDYQERIYNLKGFEIERKLYYNEKLDLHSYYSYDSSNNYIRGIGYDINNKQYNRTTIFYNKKKQPTESYFYNWDDSLVEKTVFKYDGKGNNVQTDFYDNKLVLTKTYSAIFLNKSIIKREENYISGKFIFEYNNGRLVKMTETSMNKNIESLYDLYGNPIKTIGVDGNESFQVTYRYDYDEHNNWIKKYQLTKDGSYKIAEKREIVYY